MTLAFSLTSQKRCRQQHTVDFFFFSFLFCIADKQQQEQQLPLYILDTDTQRRCLLPSGSLCINLIYIYLSSSNIAVHCRCTHIYSAYYSACIHIFMLAVSTFLCVHWNHKSSSFLRWRISPPPLYLSFLSLYINIYYAILD